MNPRGTMNRLFGFLSAAVVVMGLWFGYNAFHNHLSTREVSEIILQYSAQSKLFVWENLLDELTGTKITLETILIDEKMAYFSLPVSEDVPSTLKKMVEKPELVEFSKARFPPYKLGELILPKRGVHFFRTPVENFKINPMARITIPFQEVTYDPTAEELALFLVNRVLFGGPGIFTTEVNSVPLETINFGTMVTIPGEPSLSRLAHSIVGTETNLEKQAQKLLDFVTTEIEYDWKEKYLQTQVVKKANEVLMVKSATCASLAVLYASLLEQVDINYRLVYYPNHLTVFVEGKFADDDYPHVIEYEKNRYFLAEATIRGFTIGKDYLDGGVAANSSSWTSIQQPSDRSLPTPK